MTLKNELYSIASHDVESQTFDVQLNAGHTIYGAHFPGRPITPGVCVIQMAQELLEEIAGRALNLVKVKNVKFLQVISPVETPAISFTFNKVTPGEGTWAAQVHVHRDGTSYAKVSLVCAIKE